VNRVEMNHAEMDHAELVRRAQLAFAEAQRCAGSADIVARVRRMPDGSIDVAFNRRIATQQRLRLGSIGGVHLHLAKLAGAIAKPAPKGHFYVIAVTAADDSDAAIVVAPKVASEHVG
jgi:hypothetical protein